MKRCLTFLLALALLLAFPACRKDGKDRPNPSEGSGQVLHTEALTDVWLSEAYPLPDGYSCVPRVRPLWNAETGALICAAIDPEHQIHLLDYGADMSLENDTPIPFEDDEMLIAGAMTEDGFFGLITKARDAGLPMYRLLRLAPDTGDMTWSEEINKLFPSTNYAGILGFAVDADGNCWLGADNGGVIVLDSGFVMIASFGTTAASSMFAAPDGKVWIPLKDGFSILDKEIGGKGTHVSLPDRPDAVAFPEGFDFCYSSGSGVWGVRGEERVILMDYDNSNVTAGNLTLLGAGEDVLLFAESTKDCTLATVFRRGEDIRLDDMTVLEIAETIDIDAYLETRGLRESIMEFNRTHADVKIVLTDYTEYNTKENPGGGVQKLMIEMLNGLAEPDLLICSTEDEAILKIVKSRLYTDLGPFLDADPEVNRETVIGAVQRYFDDGAGGMWGISPSFYLHTLVSTKELLGRYAEKEASGWTTDEFLDYIASLSPDTRIQENLTAEKVFRVLLRGSPMRSFYQRDEGTCTFDSPEFVRLLEFIASLPKNAQELERTAAVPMAERDDYYYHGKIALSYFSISDQDALKRLEAQYGTKDWVMIGFPCADGNGSVLGTRSCFMMTSFCRDTALGWELLRSLLTDFEPSLSNFSSLKTVYDRQSVSVADRRHVYYFGKGIDLKTGGDELPKTQEELTEPGYLFEIKKADTDRLRTLLDDVIGYPLIDSVPNPIMEIVEEEVSALIAGVGSAEDCAAKIQSRAAIWAAEQK
ncbi:MAG: hypothetical protein K6A33_04185 [Clostridiales bacterium]|nr:hypothetical protein [Clostridiales bacterium]